MTEYCKRIEVWVQTPKYNVLVQSRWHLMGLLAQGYKISHVERSLKTISKQFVIMRRGADGKDRPHGNYG